jgi:hypothetical protein
MGTCEEMMAPTQLEFSKNGLIFLGLKLNVDLTDLLYKWNVSVTAARSPHPHTPDYEIFSNKAVACSAATSFSMIPLYKIRQSGRGASH